MICAKCRKTVKVISKFLDDKLTAALEIAHSITTEIAKVIDNPLFQLLISQLPAGVNTDLILSKIEEVLTVSDDLIQCKDLTGLEKVNCLMQGLNLLPRKQRNSLLLRLKSELVADLDGNRYEGFVYDTAAQMSYFNEKVIAGANVEKDGEQRTPEIVKVVSGNVILTGGNNAVSTSVNQTASTFAQPISETPQAAARTPQAF